MEDLVERIPVAKNREPSSPSRRLNLTPKNYEAHELLHCYWLRRRREWKRETYARTNREASESTANNKQSLMTIAWLSLLILGSNDFRSGAISASSISLLFNSG